MHLVVEAVGARRGGGAVVLKTFLEHCVDDARFEKITVLCSPRAVRDFDFPESNRLVEEALPGPDRSYPSRFDWYTRRFAGRLRDLDADAVLCMNAMGNTGGVPAVALVQQPLPFARRARRKLRPSLRLRMRVIAALSAACCRDADTVVVPTPWMRPAVVETYGVDPASIEIVTPVVDVDVDLHDGPRSGLLYVGNALGYKSLETLTAAMWKLRPGFPDLRLRTTATPDTLPVATVGLDPIGWVERDAVLPEYAGAAALLMPSLVESIGLSQIEAMACGCPVVAADLPYAHDVCGDAALYFEAENAEDCAACIAGLLRDEAVAAALSQRGRRRHAELKARDPWGTLLDVIAEAAP